MKAIFIGCNQALYEEVMDLMEEMGVRGFTSWEEVAGCGAVDGEPHLGSAAWPTMNSAIIAMVEEPLASQFMTEMKKIDDANNRFGLRAFWWEVGGMV